MVKSACSLNNMTEYKPNRYVDHLVNSGLLKRSEFNGVKFYICDGLAEYAYGMAPYPDTILLSRVGSQFGLHDQAALIAHEMTHIRQQRRYGYEEFACNYAKTYARMGKAAFGCKNPYEREAYDFEGLANFRLNGNIAGSQCNRDVLKKNTTRVKLNVRKQPTDRAPLAGHWEYGKCVSVAQCEQYGNKTNVWCYASDGATHGYILAKTIYNNQDFTTLTPGCRK